MIALINGAVVGTAWYSAFAHWISPQIAMAITVAGIALSVVAAAFLRRS